MLKHRVLNCLRFVSSVAADCLMPLFPRRLISYADRTNSIYSAGNMWIITMLYEVANYTISAAGFSAYRG
jgi:hypothetical protein